MKNVSRAKNNVDALSITPKWQIVSTVFAHILISFMVSLKPKEITDKISPKNFKEHKGNSCIMNKNDFVLKFKYSKNLKKASENCQRFYFSRYNLFGLFFLSYFEPRMFQSILQSDSLLRIIF